MSKASSRVTSRVYSSKLEKHIVYNKFFYKKGLCSPNKTHIFVDNNVFIAQNLSAKSRGLIQTFCSHCPVQTDCLKQGFVEDKKYRVACKSTGGVGIWGGLSWQDRRKILYEFLLLDKEDHLFNEFLEYKVYLQSSLYSVNKDFSFDDYLQCC